MPQLIQKRRRHADVAAVASSTIAAGPALQRQSIPIFLAVLVHDFEQPLLPLLGRQRARGLVLRPPRLLEDALLLRARLPRHLTCS